MALTQISTDGIKNGTITGADLATPILLGGTSSRDVAFTHILQLEGTASHPHSISQISNRADAHASHFDFAKTRGSGLGSTNIVQDDDFLGHIIFRGSDGTDLATQSSRMSGAVDGTPGSNTIPGRLEFYTQGTNGGSPVERARITSAGVFKMPDNGKISLGGAQSGSGDLEIYHSGTNTYISNSTGTLFTLTDTFEIRGSNANETHLKTTDNGAVELYHNNSKKFETTSTGVTVTGQIISDGLNMGDSEMIKLGSSNDLLIYHNGSDSYVQDDGTGKLVLSTNGARIDLYDNTNVATLARFITGGSVELYEAGNKKFETTSAGVRVQGQLSVANTASGGVSLSIADNAKAAFGTGDDLQIYHDGSHTYADNSTGFFHIRSNSAIRLQKIGGEPMIYAIPDGAVELYYDQSKKFETTSDGATFSGSALFPDNQRIKIGGDASNPDLQIYHDGSNTRIIEGGTGDFYVDTSSFIFRNAAGSENLAKFIQDGAVELYHNNNKKFETTNAGINVEGSITADDIITAGALLHEDDTDTLVHFSAANTIQLKTGGSSRLLVNNFGINLENGHLNTNGNRIILGDSSGATDDRIIFGNNNDLGIYHDGTDDVIHSTGTSLRTRSNIFRANNAANNKVMFRSFSDGAFEAYHNGNKKFETTSSGATVTGRLKQTVGCAFRARATSDGQTVANNTATKVNFGTQVYDYGDVYNPSNSRFTAPVDGVYNFSWSVRMGTPANTPKLDAEIRVNGNSGQNFVNCGYNQQATNNAAWIGSGDMFMSAGDYAELFVDQNTGGTATLTSNSNANSVNNHLWWTGHLVHAT